MFIYTSLYVNIRPRLGTHLDIYIELLVFTLAGNVPTALITFHEQLLKVSVETGYQKDGFWKSCAKLTHIYGQRSVKVRRGYYVSACRRIAQNCF